MGTHEHTPPAQPLRRSSFWGWGFVEAGPGEEREKAITALLAARFAIDVPAPQAPPRIEDVALPAPRIAPPAALAGICTSDPEERAGHAYGKSFRDVVRALRREYPNPPDLVAYPRDEAEVAALLDWCGDAGVVAIRRGSGWRARASLGRFSPAPTPDHECRHR